MRAISTLRLSDKERSLFLDSLKRYGFESSADFLRAAARALIAHNIKGDNELEFPLSFRVRPPNSRDHHKTGV
jgi:hypothetical protein